MGNEQIIMVMYFLIACILMIYFEILGQTINNYLKINNNPFNLFIGLSSYLGVMYISSSWLTSDNCSFYTILFINLIIFVVSLIAIYKQRLHLKFTFNIFEFCLIVLMSFISLYFSYNTTLGDLDGFDSTFYLNFVIGAIEKKDVNAFHILYGYNGYGRAVTESYFYQSYYYFCSIIVYLISKIFNILRIDYLYATIYIWVFQIVYTFSLMSLFINGMKRYLKGKHILSLLLCMFFVLGYSKIYWNSVYGFFGNTYRIVAVSYLTMYLIEILEHQDIKLLPVLSIFVLGGCAFTSSFCYISYFAVFSLMMVWKNIDTKFINWILVTLFFPSVNMLSILTTKGPYLCSAVVFCAFFLIWLLRKFISKMINYKYSKKLIVLFVSLLMFLLSYLVTKNIFDFSGFFDNCSQSADMTLDYFHGGIYNNTKLIMSLGTAAYLLLRFKDKYSIFCWILIICFFNPFCCNFLNKYNVVYYRSYELIINPLLIMYYYSKLHDLLNFKYLAVLLELIVLFYVRENRYYKKPYYYHPTFETDIYELETEGYDYLNKMSPLKSDILYELRSLILNNGFSNPYIVTGDIRTFSSIHTGDYIYGRELFNWGGFHDEASEKVYEIFKPYSYYGQYAYDVDYSKAYEYLKEASFDILVLDKEMIYHNVETDEYYSIMYLINESLYPTYENERYCIYVLNSD